MHVAVVPTSFPRGKRQKKQKAKRWEGGLVLGQKLNLPV